MIYLMLEIWFWVFLSFAVGVFVGWMFWGRNGLTAEERIEYRVMKSREESKILVHGKYHIKPVNEEFIHQLERNKKRDGPVRARHL
ncbi:MAG: hypothetical protein OXD44_02110 [Gammaproteobacteria bacterium]|nr:hypothetical protein [Gammaproteobacteria bacterium]MCY4227966.1 hypothetical protein [Gammaproteobacteria bacterium]MCY4312485.1 hypothetical protein [Gammaproteobacteria bacterium]